MNNDNMLDWLLKGKNMSIRSAKDVISRKGRILRMLETDTIDDTTLDSLRMCDQFMQSSMFIKSQLKRTVALYIEYQNTLCEEK